MNAFIRYARGKDIKDDFLATFDISAKFKYPNPSEAQKSKYFEDEFNTIFKNFFEHLQSTNTLSGKTEQEVEFNLKNKIDQSTLVLEFDTWLDKDTNFFTLAEKPKASILSPHPPYSNPIVNSNPSTNPIQPKIITPQPIKNPQLRLNQGFPFQIQRPEKPPQIAKAPPVQPTQSQPRSNQMQYVAPQQKVEEKEKPHRIRFYEKLAEYVDCPQRANIIRAELMILCKKSSN